MRGLIEKDLRLLLQRKQTLVIFLVVALIMSLSMTGPFIVGYLTMLSVIVAVSTLSYDEYDNGFAFLMTLPIDRKTYVKEKYLFSLGAAAAAWCVSIVLYSAAAMFQGSSEELFEELPALFCLLPLMFLAASVMIPLQLKYGAEKSRIVLFAVFGVITVIALTAANIVKGSVPDKIADFVRTLESMPPVIPVLIVLAVWFLLSFVSYFCSVGIMQRKEF